MQVSLQSSITTLNLSELDGERLFFHKNVEKNRFDFVIFTAIPLRNPQNIYWTLDGTPIYSSFDKDFGPPNLGQLYRFCLFVKDSIAKFSAQGKRFVFYSYESQDLIPRTNAVFLVGAYAILMEGRTPSKVLTWFAPLINHGHILPYLDVTGHNFTVSLFECWYAIHRGSRQLLWPPMEVPEIRRYEYMSEAAHGDLSWMIADKLLAFGSPVDAKFHGGDQLQGKAKIVTHEPAFYIKLFQQMQVKVVVRTCKPEYHAQDFVNAGFEHHELYFVDGSVPPMDLVNQFLDIMVHAEGAVALHCKAGLGRTGTLVCAYLMRYHGFSAAEAIAYCRIRRPGCVIGEQQAFLKNIEPQLKGLYGTFEKKKRQIPDSGHNDHAYDSDASGSYEFIHAPKAKKKKLALPILDEEDQVFENSSSSSTI